MAGRKFRMKWSDKDTPEVLKAAYLSESNSTIRMRLQALWMLRRGMKIGEVAFTLDIHYRTVHRWVNWYRKGGLDEVRVRRQGGEGRKSYLDSDEITLLKWELESGSLGSGKDVRDWVEAQCGVRYTIPGVYSLMKRAKP